MSMGPKVSILLPDQALPVSKYGSVEQTLNGLEFEDLETKAF